jgi:hypothetical protein
MLPHPDKPFQVNSAVFKKFNAFFGKEQSLHILPAEGKCG